MAQSGGMKKMMMAAAAIGMTGILASCGSGEAPDGSAKGEINSVRTEYRMGSATGGFVACNNIVGNGSRTQQTQVAVRFTLAGTIDSIKIGLKGNTDGKRDQNFTATATGQQLVEIGNGSYKVLFNADAGTEDGLLPQSIIVNPVGVKVKVVTATNFLGSFYPRIDVDTGTANFPIIALNKYTNVYRDCTVTATTNEDI